VQSAVPAPQVIHVRLVMLARQARHLVFLVQAARLSNSLRVRRTIVVPHHQRGFAAAKGRLPATPIESIYQRVTPVDHVLLRPDSYIGGVEVIDELAWRIEHSTRKDRSWKKLSKGEPQRPELVLRQSAFVPGLLKVFDEILVNASDNRQRDRSTDEIRVDIDVSSGIIQVLNTGQGIPVILHSQEGVHVAELVFGQLLTGSNFDDRQAKVTGGRNGYGAKLTNIFSSLFRVETLDESRGLFYRQEWRKNMSERDPPVCVACA